MQPFFGLDVFLRIEQKKESDKMNMKISIGIVVAIV